MQVEALKVTNLRAPVSYMPVDYVRDGLSLLLKHLHTSNVIAAGPQHPQTLLRVFRVAMRRSAQAVEIAEMNRLDGYAILESQVGIMKK